MRTRSPVPPPWLPRAAIMLLTCWCGLGLLHTGYVMIRPHGLIIRRPPELVRTIGLPGDRDSRTVVDALELLADPGLPADSPVLVVRPMDAEAPFWDYIHFQLAQLAYPRRIDLVAEGEAPPLAAAGYSAILAPAQVVAGTGWVPWLTRAELTLYRRTEAR